MLFKELAMERLFGTDGIVDDDHLSPNQGNLHALSDGYWKHQYGPWTLQR